MTATLFGEAGVAVVRWLSIRRQEVGESYPLRQEFRLTQSAMAKTTLIVAVSSCSPVAIGTAESAMAARAMN